MSGNDSRDSGKIVFLCSRNAAISSNEMTLIVDNLSATIFDVYNLPANDLSLPLIGSHAKIHKQCTFVDGICGSNSNNAHIMDVTIFKCFQRLTSGKGLFWKHLCVYIVDQPDK